MLSTSGRQINSASTNRPLRGLDHPPRSTLLAMIVPELEKPSVVPGETSTALATELPLPPSYAETYVNSLSGDASSSSSVLLTPSRSIGGQQHLSRDDSFRPPHKMAPVSSPQIIETYDGDSPGSLHSPDRRYAQNDLRLVRDNTWRPPEKRQGSEPSVQPHTIPEESLSSSLSVPNTLLPNRGASVSDTDIIWSRSPPPETCSKPFTPMFLFSSDSLLNPGNSLNAGFPHKLPKSLDKMHPFLTHDVQASDWEAFLSDLHEAGRLGGKLRFAAGIASFTSSRGFRGEQLLQYFLQKRNLAWSLNQQVTSS